MYLMMATYSWRSMRCVQQGDEPATEWSIPEVSIVGVAWLCITVNGRDEWEE